MNIFATDKCPKISAYDLDDIRVNKMISETCQMLSTVCHKSRISNSLLMKPCYEKHGCTLWAGKTHSNFIWLVQHLKYLLQAFDLFGQPFSHQRARSLLVLFESQEILSQLPQGPLTEWYNATPFKDKDCVWSIHEKYMEYMCDKWKRENPRWTNRQTPVWR